MKKKALSSKMRYIDFRKSPTNTIFFVCLKLINIFVPLLSFSCHLLIGFGIHSVCYNRCQEVGCYDNPEALHYAQQYNHGSREHDE